MQFKAEKITPKMAAKWLKECNQINRPLSKLVVAKYAKAMSEGQWRLTHQGIAFAGDRLLDGQHRLAAVVRCGAPVTMMVARGCDEDTFPHIDNLPPRDASDLIEIQCKRDGGVQHNLKKVTATVSMMTRFQPDGVWLVGGHNPSRDHVFAAYSKLRARPDWTTIEAAASAGGYRAAGCSGHAMWSAIRVVATLAVGKPKADDFFDRTSDGANLPTRDPRLALRTRLLDNRTATARKMTKEGEVGAIVRAWNAYYTGRELVRIQVDNFMPPMQGAVGIDLGIGG